MLATVVLERERGRGREREREREMEDGHIFVEELVFKYYYCNNHIF